MRNLIRDAAGNYFEAANLSSEEEMVFLKSEVVLTIDWRLQYIVDEALQNGASVNNAEWAAAVCMDPMTGEILAMSSFPSFDPGKRDLLGRCTQKQRDRQGI
ncbi:MAG: hypothetical protein ABC360_00500 [Acetomicrobium sp.]